MPHVDFGAFALDAPKGWSLATLILTGPVDDNPVSSGMLTAKAARPFQQNLIATMEEVGKDETAESYVRKQLEGLKRAGVQRQDGAAPEKLKLKSGIDGLITEQVVVGPQGERVRQLQLVAIKQGVAFTLIASHLDGPSYERSKPRFREMLLSFA